jgi:hypothetical protein
MSIVKEAYNLFKDIPEEQWTTGKFSNNIDKCCAIGHWIRLHSSDPTNFSLDNCKDYTYDTFFRFKMDEIIIEKYNPTRSVDIPYESFAQINNYETGHFQQKTPKQRVIALLNELLEYEREKEISTL